MKRVLLFVVVLVSIQAASAQTFKLNVAFDSSPRGKVTLMLYNTDTLPRVTGKKMSRNRATFRGELSHPTYAEVIAPNGQKTSLFLENSDINLLFNGKEPEMSHVTGSRTNSQYRYVLEQCREGDGSYNTARLAEHARKDKAATYTPLLIYRYLLPRCEPSTVRELVSMLEGDALESYHYQLLVRELQQPGTQAVGGTNQMPDIVFFDSRHKSLHSDSLLSDSSYNLVIVGATWCKQCSNAKQEASRQHEGLNIITIDIDNDKRLWDADVVGKLQIEHIPYLILIDRSKKIVARDIRAWELKRLLKAENR